MDRRITVLCERSQQQKTNTSVDLDVGRGRDKYLKRRLVLELSSGQRSVTEKGDGETAVSRDLDSKDSAGEASEEGVSVVFQQDRGSRRSDHWTHANCCHYRCSLSRLSGIRQKSPPASPFFSSCPTGRLALMRSERENSGFHCIPVGTFRIPCHSSALPTPQGGQREQAAREGDLGPQAHIGRAQGPAHLPAGAKERGVPGGPPAPCQFHRLRCVQEAQLPAPGRGWQRTARPSCSHSLSLWVPGGRRPKGTPGWEEDLIARPPWLPPGPCFLSGGTGTWDGGMRGRPPTLGKGTDFTESLDSNANLILKHEPRPERTFHPDTPRPAQVDA
nr:uncharacterized protein LOC105861111 isoform X5 [Microcebus murinus]